MKTTQRIIALLLAILIALSTLSYVIYNLFS